MSEYRIGEFAKKLCVSQDLLKHYEKYEILSSTKKGPGGYRYYDFRQSPRILFSRQLQNWGFSLKEISRIIKGISCAETYDMLSGRLKVLKEDHGVLFWHIRYLESLCSLLERVESGNFHGQWFVQNTEPCLFIPHTNGYDFLPDNKNYRALQRWITLQGITKQAAVISNIKSDKPALTHGFTIPAEAARELGLGESRHIDTIGGGRSFIYNSTLPDRTDIDSESFVRRLMNNPMDIAYKHNFELRDSALVITHFLSSDDKGLARHRELIFSIV